MSAYETILGVVAEAAEEPEALALEILTALRMMPDEVAQAAVDPHQWEKAFEAMVAVASEADQTRRGREEDCRRQAWPEMLRQFEMSGCKVTPRDAAAWRVVGTGVSVDIDLSTGDIEHSDGQVGEQLPEFGDIADHIIRSVRTRETDRADLARRIERRKTHRWDNKKKVWLPRSRGGEIIQAGQ